MTRSAFPSILWRPRAVSPLLFLRLARFAVAVLSSAFLLRVSQSPAQADVVIDFNDGRTASWVGALYAEEKNWVAMLPFAAVLLVHRTERDAWWRALFLALV
jgi:hypothetical protein